MVGSHLVCRPLLPRTPCSALVIQSDGTPLTERRLNRVQRASRSVLVRLADGFAANSRQAARRFLDLGAAPETVHAAPHSTHLEPYWAVGRRRLEKGCGTAPVGRARRSEHCGYWWPGGSCRGRDSRRWCGRWRWRGEWSPASGCRSPGRVRRRNGSGSWPGGSRCQSTFWGFVEQLCAGVGVRGSGCVRVAEHRGPVRVRPALRRWRPGWPASPLHSPARPRIWSWTEKTGWWWTPASTADWRRRFLRWSHDAGLRRRLGERGHALGARAHAAPGPLRGRGGRRGSVAAAS